MQSGIESSKENKYTSLIGMVGGIAVVVLVALLQSSVSFSLERRGAVESLRRLGAGRAERVLSFVGLSSVIIVFAELVSAVGLFAVKRTVAQALLSFGTPVEVEIPFGMLGGLLLATIPVLGFGFWLGQMRPSKMPS